MLGLSCQMRAQRIVHAIRKPRNHAHGAIAPKPGGTGLSGRSAVSRRSPMGPTIGFASLRASHPGKPPSRPRGAYSEVPYPSPFAGAVMRNFALHVVGALLAWACVTAGAAELIEGKQF